jgi:site-specific DNA recombinase
VRAHDWYERIVAGAVHDLRSLARETGLNERYIGRVLQCAFLAPDVIEAILDGRQPSELTLERLLKKLPVDWAEQRMRFGFPSK